MEQLSIHGVLAHYGLDVQLFEGWRGVHCPFHEGGDIHESARACETGFACLACGIKGDAINLIRTVEKVDFRTAVAYYEKWTGSSYTRVSNPVKRKSWGRKPFSARDYEQESGGFQARVRRKPFSG